MADHHPKRILALSGGGVRGIVEVAFLEAVERAYQRRFGPETKLNDVFHLVGGTSTGALIATAISLGLPLPKVRDFYLKRAKEFFLRRRRLSYLGYKAAFDADALEREIRRIIGDLELGDPALRTYLAIVTKRLDTGSPWILSNAPKAPYFEDPPDGSFRGNRHYSLARLLTASTAAPTYFAQRQLEIGPGETGTFVDGGLSPHNDPSLALLKIARLRAFGICWPANARDLFILSIGTGRYRMRVAPRLARRLGPIPLAVVSMRGMVADAEQQTLAMMQWLGTSKRYETINSEVENLEQDLLTPEPAFSYLRLDLPLEADPLADLGLNVGTRELRKFRSLDEPGIIEPIYELTQRYIDVALDLDVLLEES